MLFFSTLFFLLSLASALPLTVPQDAHSTVARRGSLLNDLPGMEGFRAGQKELDRAVDGADGTVEDHMDEVGRMPGMDASKANLPVKDDIVRGAGGKANGALKNLLENGPL